MPSAFCRFAILRKRHHGLDHDVRIDTAFRQSQLSAAKLLEIKLSQAFRASEIALRIVRDAVSGEEVAEVEPKAGFRVMRVTILEAFDVAKGLRVVKNVFKLYQSSPDCREVAIGCDLSPGSHCNRESGYASRRR